MFESLFSVLIGLVGIVSTVYATLYNKKSLPLILALTAFSYICLFYWQASIAIVILFIIYRRMNYSSFASLNMFAAVLLSWFFLNAFLIINTPYYIYIAIILAFLICGLAIFGILQNNLRKFLLISSAIQIIFVALDLSIAKMLGQLSILGTVQVFNYTIAGLALFFTIGVLGAKAKKISELEGSFFSSMWNDTFATIACLSLAGLPGFNMFVSEWVLFTKGYMANPIIAVFGIFAALLLFIMYYKIVYVLLVGTGRPKIIPRIMTALNGVFATSCVVLGLLPMLQWHILTQVF